LLAGAGQVRPHQRCQRIFLPRLRQPIRLLPASPSVAQGRLSSIYTSRDIDFLVGYVVPDNVWYVIPIEVFLNIGCVKVFPSSKRRMSRYEKYREAWDYFRPEAAPTGGM